MKIEKSFSTLVMLVMFMLSFYIHAQADNCDGERLSQESKKAAEAIGEKLDECGFQVTNPNNVRTKSNPKLRPVEIIQPDEYVEYEAVGQMPSAYNKGYINQGWLVNSCVVLGPRHAVIGNGNVDKDLTNIQVDFEVGYQGKNSYKQQVKITPISCGRGNNSDEMGGEDFCIFKVDRSLKGLVKPIKIGAIDFQRYDIVPTTSVGFFPQASSNYDVLAKDVNAKIVDGDPSYLESRAAINSGAGLIDVDSKTQEKKLIGLQVGYFKAVNSARVLEEVEKIGQKDRSVFKCN